MAGHKLRSARTCGRSKKATPAVERTIQRVGRMPPSSPNVPEASSMHFDQV